VRGDDEDETTMDLEVAAGRAYTLTYFVMVALIIIGLLLYQ